MFALTESNISRRLDGQHINHQNFTHDPFNTEKIHFITLISFIQKPLKKGD